MSECVHRIFHHCIESSLSISDYRNDGIVSGLVGNGSLGSINELCEVRLNLVKSILYISKACDSSCGSVLLDRVVSPVVILDFGVCILCVSLLCINISQETLDSYLLGSDGVSLVTEVTCNSIKKTLECIDATLSLSKHSVSSVDSRVLVKLRLHALVIACQCCDIV